MYTLSYTNTHHDVIDLVNHEIVQNTEVWISWEWDVTILRNKKNSYPEPHMTYFEKLSFCSGGNI